MSISAKKHCLSFLVAAPWIQKAQCIQGEGIDNCSIGLLHFLLQKYVPFGIKDLNLAVPRCVEISIIKIPGRSLEVMITGDTLFSMPCFSDSCVLL